MKRVFTKKLIPKKSTGVLPLLGGTCLFLFTSFLVQAQQRAVSVVEIENGQPSADAVVLIESTSHSAATKTDGRLFTCAIIKYELNQI